MEKPIDFCLRKGKAVGETTPTETTALAQKKAVPVTASVVPVLPTIKNMARNSLPACAASSGKLSLFYLSLGSCLFLFMCQKEQVKSAAKVIQKI